MRAVLVFLLSARAAAAAPPIVFTGNDAFPAAELERAMGEVGDQEELEIGLLRLSAYYWDRGYANVRVGDMPWARSGIAIPIDEGPKFTIGSVVVRDHGELDDLLVVGPGMTFSRTAIARDRDNLELHLQDQGYAFANVVPLTQVDLAHATIDLTWEIDRGKRARFGRFEIHDAPTELVRRELGLAEGEAFSESRLLAGKRRLIARGFADLVIATKRGRAADLVDVIVERPSAD